MAKIMITDDALFMRMVLRKILEDAGYEVVEAINGHDAIKQYDAHQPDVVTMDITMPDIEGTVATAEIIKKHPDARIIMCSAMGQQWMMDEAKAAGAKGFIVKPFDKAQVLREISHLLS